MDGLERFFPVVLDKTVYQNADAIARQLDAIGVGEVNLFGIDTDICVLQNAARLFDLGYRVNVLYDLCATNAGFTINSRCSQCFIAPSGASR